MKIAIVVPRYGPDVGGGAEGLARWYARALSSRHDVVVLTTAALDYMTWAPHYGIGVSRDDRVTVMRFGVPVGRDVAAFNELTAHVLSSGEAISVETEEGWMRDQGPVSPGLLDHLRLHGDTYDAVLFTPYLYATTALGLPLVADRSLLIPALHDEGPAYLAVMRRTFHLARGLGFLTPEEREFSRALFGNCGHHHALLGIGIEEPTAAAPERCLRPREPYVLYVGRIDPSKGSRELFEYHRSLRRRHEDAPMLVLAGRAAMEVPEAPWLRHVGFVSEAEKADLIRSAICSVLPSPYESLSISTLETWSHGRPVIVSAGSEVLKGQVRRANGGLWFADPDDYADAVMTLRHNPAVGATLGENGRRYTRFRYSPDAVLERLEGLIMSVADDAAA